MVSSTPPVPPVPCLQYGTPCPAMRMDPCCNKVGLVKLIQFHPWLWTGSNPVQAGEHRGSSIPFGAEGNLCMRVLRAHRFPPPPLSARQLLGSDSPCPHPGAGTELTTAAAGIAWLIAADASLLSDTGDISRVSPPGCWTAAGRIHILM